MDIRQFFKGVDIERAIAGVPTLLLIVLIAPLALTADAPVEVLDPFGLGERLALMDYLREHHQQIPKDPTVEQLREIYRRSLAPTGPTTQEAAAERDRCQRLRAALQKDFGVNASDSASESELLVLATDLRTKHDQANQAAAAKAAKQELAEPKTENTASDHALALSYNKFDDVTFLRTALRVPLRMRQGANGLEQIDSAIAANLGVMYRGQDLTKFPVVRSLSLHSTSRRWRFLESHHIILMADSQRIDLGKGKHDGDIHDDGSVSESVRVFMTDAQLAVLSKATQIDGQIGGVSFALDRDEMLDIAELTGVMERLRRPEFASIIGVIFAKIPDKTFPMTCAVLDGAASEAYRRLQEIGQAPAEPPSSRPAPPDVPVATPPPTPSPVSPDVRIAKAVEPAAGTLPMHHIEQKKIGVGGGDRAIYILCETRPTRVQIDALLAKYRPLATAHGQVVVKIYESGDWWPMAADNMDGSPVIYQP